MSVFLSASDTRFESCVLHGTRQNLEKIHVSKGQSCKKYMACNLGRKQKPAINTSFRKSLMAGNLLFAGLFGQIKRR